MLHIKSWLSEQSPVQKFLSSVLAHHLSRTFNRREFEVVLDSFIDFHNMESDVADIVVYNVKKNFSTDLIIEFCHADDFKSTITSLEIITEIYKVREAFIYNTTTSEWFLISEGLRMKSSHSRVFKIDLNEILLQAKSRYAA